MATIVTTADKARAAWVLAPANTDDELAAWNRLYDAAVPRPAKHGPGLKRAIRRFRGRYVGPVFALEALMLQLGTKRREFDR